MKRFSVTLFRRLVRPWRLLAVAGLILGTTSAWNLLPAVPTASAAGEDLRIKSLKLSLWPEYDDPRLLVIYQGEFTDGGTFPRDVKFRAPKDASVQMACALTPQQEHKCQVYDTIFEGDFKTIVFTLPIPTFYFEYYNSQTEGSTDKSVDYQFVNPPYTIDSLDMEIQQPLKATNFAINPSTTSAATDNQGFKYFNYKYSAVPADKALNFAISYTKPDAEPSVKKKSDATASGEGQSNSLIVIASVVGLAAILGASYYFSSRRKQQKRYGMRALSSARVRQAERNAFLPKEVPPGPVYRGTSRDLESNRHSDSGFMFCSVCGTRLEVGDVFCYHCGQAVTPRSGAAKGKRR